MLLTRIEIENFRGIRRLDVGLDRLTVLIGENLYGKSSLFDALSLVLGDGASSEAVHLTAADFHTPQALPTPPPASLMITLWFSEAQKGQFNAGSFASLRELADDEGRICLQLRADRPSPQGPVTTAWRGGRLQRDLAPADAARMIAHLRSLVPLVLLRGGWTDQAPRLPTTEPSLRSGESGESSRRRVDELYSKLLKSPDSVLQAEFAEGLEAARQLWDQSKATAPATASLQSEDPEEFSRAETPVRMGLTPKHSARSSTQPSAQSSVSIVLLVGAILRTWGSRKAGRDAQPLLVIEDIEAHLHPRTLSSLWAVVSNLPVQRLITTNSPELLASVPLRSIRRLVRRPAGVEVFQVKSRTLSADDMRRVGYHLRVNRAGSMLSRCWLLVEGETEFWLLPELARVCGIDLYAEGVRVVEFAQCGVGSLIKLADALGIQWHLMADGDRAGQSYADATRRLLRGRPASERLTLLPERDVEHCLWYNGYARVFASAAGVNPRDLRRANPTRVIQAAIGRLSKPQLALEIVEASDRPNAPPVPPVLRSMFETAAGLAAR